MQASEDDKNSGATAVAVPFDPALSSAPALTGPMRRALTRAATRPAGNFCPVVGVHANAETMLLEALDRRGFIAWDNPAPSFNFTGSGAPRINDAGRAALRAAEQSQPAESTP